MTTLRDEVSVTVRVSGERQGNVISVFSPFLLPFLHNLLHLWVRLLPFGRTHLPLVLLLVGWEQGLERSGQEQERPYFVSLSFLFFLYATAETASLLLFR
jgi:hypothetical protein